MKPANHPQVAHGRVGVLLINLGTPDAPEAAAVRRYLAEFLSDELRFDEMADAIYHFVWGTFCDCAL